MTYGWAMLVVLAAVGALAYMGVLSPQKYVGNKCTSTAGISCQGEPDIYYGGDTQVYVTIIPSTGHDLTFNGADVVIKNHDCTYVKFCPKGYKTSDGSHSCQKIIDKLYNTDLNDIYFNAVLTDSTPYTMGIQCSGGTKGDSLNLKVTIPVKDSVSGLIKNYDIDVSGRIR